MPNPTAATIADHERGFGARRPSDFFVDFGMVWALLAIVIIAVIAYPGLFAFSNIRNMFGQSAPVGIVAVGMTFVIIAGGLDFSVGAIFALAAVLFAKMTDPLGLWGAAGVVLLASLAAGFVNGFVINKLKVSPFVVPAPSCSCILTVRTP